MRLGRPHPQTRIPEVIERLDERGLFGRLARLAKSYSVDVNDVLSRKRSRRVVMARDACIMNLIRESQMSTTEIGDILGMHHTSVMAARDRYLERDNGKLVA